MNRYFSTFIAAFIFTNALFALINFSSCTETPVNPYDKLKPGRRDYVWEVDTLNAPYNIYYSIWGSSPKDIWMVSGGDWAKSIAHYNGKQWTLYGVNGIVAPSSIYGFSFDNIFVSTENGKIMKFDGQKWSEYAKLQIDGINYFVFQNIWGTDPNNIYAVGAGPDHHGFFNKTIMAQYKAKKWSLLNTNLIKGIVVHFYTNESDKRNYFRLTKIGGLEFPDSTIIYEYKDNSHIRLYSSIQTWGKQADISLIDNKVYFILGNEIATRSNNRFKTVVKVENPNFYQRIWGRNAKDIFLLMVDGLAHYNGTNIEYLFYFNKTPRTQIYGAALFEKEVFFSVYEDITGLKYIYHGKLE